MEFAAETVQDLDVFHLFIFDPFWLEDTVLGVNRVVVLMWFASLLCIGFFWLGSRKGSLVPKKLQTVAETGYLFVRNNIALDIIGPHGAKYVPYLASLFFFIFFSNIMGILPGVNFPITSRMGIPFVLAILSWIIFIGVGVKKHGFSYFKDTLFPPGIPWWVYIILTPIELVSVFLIRPFTLMVRLLANMFAGHVLLTVFFLFTNQLLLDNIITAPLGLVTLLVGSALILFEFLVATIQAYIFTALTAFYISESEHGHGEQEFEAEGDASQHYETELATAS